MSLLKKLSSSNFSLEGNGFFPQSKTAAWGFADSANTVNPLDPKVSRLQYTYDVNSTPKVRIVDFNKTQYKSFLPLESQLDELDLRSPKNLRAGGAGSVVSQIYKSPKDSNYRSLGPAGGRY